MTPNKIFVRGFFEFFPCSWNIDILLFFYIFFCTFVYFFKVKIRNRQNPLTKSLPVHLGLLINFNYIKKMNRVGVIKVYVEWDDIFLSFFLSFPLSFPVDIFRQNLTLPTDCPAPWGSQWAIHRENPTSGLVKNSWIVHACQRNL